MTFPIMTEETNDQELRGPEANGGGGDARMTWSEANQRHLVAAFTALRVHLAATLEGGVNGSAPFEDAFANPREWSLSRPPALEQLCSAFELTTFERDVLLLAAGAEMDSQLGAHFASLDANRRPLPTFQLALTVLPDAHWSALSPSQALRRWQLIDLLAADTLVESAFRPNERILHFLAGVSGIDERLHSMVQAVSAPETLPASYAAVAAQVAAVWTDATRHAAASNMAEQLPLIELCGTEPDANRAIAVRAAASLHLRLHVLAVRNLLQTSSAEMNLFLRLWEREAILSESALLIELDDAPTSDTASATISLLIESLRTPLILSSRQPQSTLNRTRVLFHTSRPIRAEQAELWRAALLPADAAANDALIDTLVGQFDLSPLAIRSAAQHSNRSHPEQSLASVLWDACRVEARPRLEGLAQRIEPAATWDDLVLPEKERRQMKNISLQVRLRTCVYENWGFADRGSRGLGISVLFAGPSGTGKTTAAEVLAHELRLDLFRIDLSQIISKYIGETEKNLRNVFDAADQGAAVLLFDEADALFGKRTEVKDSHDRYANCEVSYLLQRMEAYRGLAILTTNRKSSLDQAFLRRLRFVIEFPFPEAAQRAEIWRRIFPVRTPIEGINVESLARLRVSGGNIHNIAMGAAFLAADAREPVRMEHLLAATRAEFAKLEIPLNDTEVARWT